MHNVGFSLPSLHSFALTSCSSFLPPQFLSGPVASECSPVGDLHPVKMEMSWSKAIPCLVAELSGVYTASAWLYSLKKNCKTIVIINQKGFLILRHVTCLETMFDWAVLRHNKNSAVPLTHVLSHKNITPCPPQPPVAPVKHCIHFLNPSKFTKPSAINWSPNCPLCPKKWSN